MAIFFCSVRVGYLQGGVSASSTQGYIRPASEAFKKLC